MALADRRFYRAAAWAIHISVPTMLVMLAGCGPKATPYPASLESERPIERITAIKKAAQLDDYSAIGVLIDRLEDDDPAVRMFAIMALERMTGTRLGYDYRADDTQRWRAVQVWRRFWVQRPECQTPRQFAEQLAGQVPSSGPAGICEPSNPNQTPARCDIAPTTIPAEDSSP